MQNSAVPDCANEEPTAPALLLEPEMAVATDVADAYEPKTGGGGGGLWTIIAVAVAVAWA